MHVTQTKNRGKADEVIFRMAGKDDRLPIVFNTKHFKPLISKNSTYVVSLSTNLTDKQADLKICKVLKNLSVSQTKGRLISISKGGIIIKEI